MKRYLHIVLILLLISGNTFAQKGYKRFHKNQLYEANVFFDLEDYYFAYELYEELYPIDTNFTEINAKMGISLFNMYNRHQEAFKHLKAASEMEHTESMFYLASLHLRNEDFEAAENLLNKYRKKADRYRSVKEIERLSKQIEYAIAAYSNPGRETIKNAGAGINSKFQDYAPIIDNNSNKIYFTSRRPAGNKEQDVTGQYFENIYSVQIPNPDSVISLGAPLNTATNDAAVSLSTNGDFMLIYRTNKQLSGGDLYLSEKKDPGWGEPVILSDRINSNFQEASASFGVDDNILYFSSNRPDGYGGRDIYRVKKLPTGEWSLPQNLGPVINTPYNEDAPFINSDGKLYFSSEGHTSMGGYDIFKSEKNHFGWSEPRNLGYPINTTGDDIYYSINEDGSIGYFSSDRSGGLGAQDMYKVILKPYSTVVIRGVVTTQAEGIPAQAKISVINDEDGLVEGVYNVNSGTGKFILALNANKHYTIHVESDGYKTLVESKFYKNPYTQQIIQFDEVFNLIEKQ